MNPAIVCLEQILEVYATNEPINRSAGNIEQADMELEYLLSIQKAIEHLKNYNEE